jgi:carbamoyl-phosphate synthase small subunit
MANALLVIEDGNFMYGRHLGKAGASFGTLCFNTAMSGYEEVLTDPSYKGQVVVFTFPHIGNTGINLVDQQSEKAQISGVILNQASTQPANYRSKVDLESWLIKNEIVGISGVDTRSLTKHIRKHSAPLRCGIFSIKEGLSEKERSAYLERVRQADPLVGSSYAFKLKEAYARTKPSAAEPAFRYPPKRTWGPRYKLVLLDFGVKKAILDELEQRDQELIVLPGGTRFKDLMKYKPDGLVLSNGPGDPNALFAEMEATLLEILASNLPLLGICFGFQLISLALGCKIIKMQTGHHGVNHPVKCLKTGRVYITSQNHEFMLDPDSLKPDILVTQRSLFDGSIAGIEVHKRPIMAVQYHPEAAPGPHDSSYLFDHFIQNLTYAQTHRH